MSEKRRALTIMRQLRKRTGHELLPRLKDQSKTRVKMAKVVLRLKNQYRKRVKKKRVVMRQERQYKRRIKPKMRV